MATRDAACSCGQLRVRAGGDPIRISICHCLACQRRSGSAFAVQARFPSDRAEISTSLFRWMMKTGFISTRIAPLRNRICWNYFNPLKLLIRPTSMAINSAGNFNPALGLVVTDCDGPHDSSASSASH